MALTCLRIALVPVFLLLLGHGRRLEAILLFAFMGLTDFLDGYLARRLNQRSRLGEILDPAADKLLVLSTLILLSSPTFCGERAIPLPVLVCILAKDVVAVLGAAWLLLTVKRAKVSALVVGKITTFLQICLVLVTLLAGELSRLGTSLDATLYILWYAVAGFSLASCIVYFRSGANQYLQYRALQQRVQEPPVGSSQSSQQPAA